MFFFFLPRNNDLVLRLHMPKNNGRRAIEGKCLPLYDLRECQSRIPSSQFALYLSNCYENYKIVKDFSVRSDVFI